MSVKAPLAYRLLLLLLPPRFRRDFGPDLEAVLVERLRDAHGATARAWIWSIAVVDVFMSAPAEWAHALRHPRTGNSPGSNGMDHLKLDLRFALRGLGRNPGFTGIAVLTLGIGIGATTAVFSLVNGLLLRPLPVNEPDRLVVVNELRRGGRISISNGQAALPYERYLAYREATTDILSGLAAQRRINFSLRAADGARNVNGIIVSGNYFDVLGVWPALGRFFSDGPDGAAGAREVVLGYDSWQNAFAADPSIIGRPVYVDGRALTVVGVAPAGFGGTTIDFAPDIWVSYEGYRQAAGAAGNAGDTWLTLFGRLTPGVTPAQVQAALAVIGPQIPAEDPDTEVTGVALQPLTGIPVSERAQVIGFLGMLFATAALVLLIASVNVAGMLLARAAARQREIAIRRAIGAGRGRLIRQLLTESVVLCLLAGAAGLLLAVWLGDALAASRPSGLDIPLDLSLDARVLGFALLVTLATGVGFALMPALRASIPELVPALREAQGGPTRRRTRLRSGFVVAQLTMSLVLLVAAGLFVRTLQHALTVDPGFEPNGVVVAGLDLDSRGYDEARGRVFYRQLVERVAALPGIESVGLAIYPPLSGNVLAEDVERANPPAGAGAAIVETQYGAVDVGYFETLRIPILAGRAFIAGDREGAPGVAIVNETLARRFWPGESAVGKRIAYEGRPLQVVGIARDGIYEDLAESTVPPYLYVPMEQWPGSYYRTLHARVEGDPGAALAAIRREVGALDPDIALVRASYLPSLIASFLLPQRFAAVLIGTFGLIGLELAAVGLYGLLAYDVAQRTPEFGLRMALGAQAGDVLRLVLWHGLAIVLGGLALGAAAAAVLTRFLSGFVFGVSPLDPVTFIGVALLLTGAALLASYLPARRATKVDPITALRYE